MFIEMGKIYRRLGSTETVRTVRITTVTDQESAIKHRYVYLARLYSPGGWMLVDTKEFSDKYIALDAKPASNVAQPQFNRRQRRQTAWEG